MRPLSDYLVQASAAITATAFVGIFVTLIQLRDGQAEIRGILATYAKGDASQNLTIADHETRIRSLERKAK